MNVAKWFQQAGKEEAVHDGRSSYSGDPDWFMVGCADYPDRETLMLLIETARNLCGMRHPKALGLLKRATERLEAGTKGKGKK